MTDSEIQKRFAKHTLDVEARRDAKGRLKVYELPAGDGGGTFEVAGINDRYHRQMAQRLRALIADGKHEQAESEAIAYLDAYTDAVDEWHPSEIVEGYLRCVSFNRGPKGAAWVLQYALKFGFSPSLYTGPLDGAFGEGTRRAAAAADEMTLLVALPPARVVYERTKLAWKGSRDETSKFWHGLFARFVNDMKFAMSILIPIAKSGTPLR